MFMLGGVIDAMKKSYEQNRKLLGKKSSLKDINENYSGKTHTKLTFKKSSPESLKALRVRLKEENRQSNLRHAIAFLIIATVLGTFAYWFLF